jgi:hypothetical protein
MAASMRSPCARCSHCRAGSPLPADAAAGAVVRGFAVAQLVELELVGQLPVLPHPVVAGVAHDAQQPRPRALAAQAVEEAEGAQVGLLHRVFGELVVAQQPAREVPCRIEVRQRGGFELACAVGRQRGQGLLLPA